MAKGPGALHKGLMIVISGGKEAAKKMEDKKAQSDAEEEKGEMEDGGTVCPKCGHKCD